MQARHQSVAIADEKAPLEANSTQGSAIVSLNASRSSASVPGISSMSLPTVDEPLRIKDVAAHEPNINTTAIAKVMALIHEGLLPPEPGRKYRPLNSARA